MILKTVTFLFKKFSTYWYTTNQGIQIHCKWFDKNNFSNLARTFINYI